MIFALLSAAAALASGPLPLSSPALALAPGLAGSFAAATFETENVAEQSTCTAFAITPDGYLLTALHCVRECLLTTQQAEQGALPQIGLSDLLVVKNPAAVGARCPEIHVASLGVNEVQVVATGPALALYDAAFFSDEAGLRQELSAKGWDRKGNDYAVLKVEAHRPLPCFALATAQPGDSLYALGFPMTGGASVLSASAGHVYGAAAESRYFREHVDAATKAWALSQFAAPGVLYSDAANEWGQSGGPIVNTQGQVIGIVSGFTSFQDASRVDVHELVGSTVENALAGLPEALRAMLRAGNASCGR